MNGYPVYVLNDNSVVSASNPLPVSLGADTVTVTGDITIPATISVASSASNPVHVHVTEFSVPIELTTGNSTIGNVNINGIIPVSLCNIPIGTYLTQPIPTGSNTIGNVGIIGTIPVSLSNISIGTYLTGSLPSGSNTIGTVNIQLNDKTISEFNPISVIQPLGSYDAFNRSRVSECFTLGDYKHIYGIDPNFLDLTSNGGTVTFVKNKACCELRTSTTSNSSTIHQTRCYHHYLPGKSHLILSSFNFRGFTSNVIKRTGYFDDLDGIYLELNHSNVMSFNVRSFVTGTVTTISVKQFEWNVDKMDGTGPSKISLDMTKTQLVFFDFQWLGVGRVRCGFAHDGSFLPCHNFYHSNNLSTVYMSNPSLPIRCEIFNIGIPPTGGLMEQICSTVISEGGYIESGIDHSVLSDVRTIPAGLGNALPILCIALRNTFNGYLNRMIVRLVQASVLAVDQNVSYQILRLDSVGYVIGGSWVNVSSISGVKYNNTATSLTNLGEAMSMGFVAASQNGSSSINIAGSSGQTAGSSAKRNFIAQNIQATDSEVYVIYVKTLTASSSQVVGGMSWREVY